MRSIQHAGVDWKAGNYPQWLHTRRLCAFLAFLPGACANTKQPYANLPTLYPRPTYMYATTVRRSYACYTQSYAWVWQFYTP